MASKEKTKLDNRHNRSDTTRLALMRAAEKLIADHGIENVTIRDILGEANQKNTSALQYHFRNLNGLIGAIHQLRSEETRLKRTELVDELLAHTNQPELRQICELMVRPVFELARSRIDFRRYVKAFGHELAMAETSALSKAASKGAGGSSGREVGVLLKEALPHLDESAYRRRMEAAVRLCSASMYHQARQANAFRGEKADLFLASILDALTGLLSAPESEETSDIAKSLADTQTR